MTLQIVLVVVLTAGAVWKGSDVARTSRGRLPRVLLAACLTLLATGQVLSLPPVTHLVDVVTTDGVGKIAYNASTMSGLFALLCFFSFATRGGVARTRRRRTLWFDAAAFSLSLVAMIALMVATPPGFRAHTLQSPELTLPVIAWFYIVGNVYFVYAYLSAGWCLWRYSAGRSRSTEASESPAPTPASAADQGRPAEAVALSLAMRVSMRVAVAGLAGLTLTSIGRAIWVIIRFNHSSPLEWFNQANWKVGNAAFILMAVGLILLATVQAVEAARIWVLHLRQYRQLTTLWSTLREAYPAVVLKGARADWFTRRVIECLDGLSRLNRYIAVAADGRDVSRCSAPEMAGYVRAALVLRPQLDDAPVASLQGPEYEPDLENLDAVVCELVALSTALKGSPA